MWIITLNIESDITMYKFETEEAIRVLESIKGGYKVLTEIISVNGVYN